MAMISKEAQQQVLYLLRNVGKKIREMQGDPTWRNVSSFEGFKTGGDQKAHSMLVAGLGNITPEIPVFSEETPHSIDDRPGQYWLIDPIDGTSSWHGGFEGYVTQLALISNDDVEMGAIYWPCRDIMFHADIAGVFINDMPAKDAQRRIPPILIDNYPEPQGIAAKLIKRMPELDYRECGSLGLKSVLALTGEADLFVKDVTVRDWDMAPAMAFAKFGGDVCNLFGEPLCLGQKIEFDDGLIVSHDGELVREILLLFKNDERGYQADRKR